MIEYSNVSRKSIHKNSSSVCRFLWGLFFQEHKSIHHVAQAVFPFVVVQLLRRIWLFVILWTAAHQASHASLSPGACSNSCPLSRWCHPTFSSSVIPFSSCLQSFPASGFFPNELALCSTWWYFMCVCVCVWHRFSCVWLFVTLWTITHQAPLYMEFSRQEYWSGLPCPPSGDLPDPGIEPTSLMSPALAGRSSLPLVSPGKPDISHSSFLINIYRSALLFSMCSVA